MKGFTRYSKRENKKSPKSAATTAPPPVASLDTFHPTNANTSTKRTAPSAEAKAILAKPPLKLSAILK